MQFQGKNNGHKSGRAGGPRLVKVRRKELPGQELGAFVGR